MPAGKPHTALLPLCLAAATLLSACAEQPKPAVTPPPVTRSAYDTPALDKMISKTAKQYNVPAALVHRVVERESSYNPRARNGPYYGLMQILPQTARTMGYEGPASGLYDAQTNLTYGVKYLRGAWLVADGSYDRAVMWYARGYYYEAKRKGLVQMAGLD
ncbi:lytic transglycosylase domain-containing protein [Thioclava sp. BHET1]|nr:lytic transglycosylase domain-containing protein [Thioclava sp. BHET1]